MDSTIQPNQIDLNTRVKCSDEQMAADLGGELAILNLKTGVYYGLDEVGARIWSLLKENLTVREVRDRILNEYAVETAKCEEDLRRLLSELVRHKLVEFCPGPDGKP